MEWKAFATTALRLDLIILWYSGLRFGDCCSRLKVSFSPILSFPCHWCTVFCSRDLNPLILAYVPFCKRSPWTYANASLRQVRGQGGICWIRSSSCHHCQIHVPCNLPIPVIPPSTCFFPIPPLLLLAHLLLLVVGSRRCAFPPALW